MMVFHTITAEFEKSFILCSIAQNLKEKKNRTPESFTGPSFVLAKKLQAMKIDIKKWNKEVLGNDSARKDAALEQINY